MIHKSYRIKWYYKIIVNCHSKTLATFSKKGLIPAAVKLRIEMTFFQNSHQPGQEITYGELVSLAYGQRGKNVVDVAICASQTGFCCAYLIFISENIAHFYHGLQEGEVRMVRFGIFNLFFFRKRWTVRSCLFYSAWFRVLLLCPWFESCINCQFSSKFYHFLQKYAIFSLFADFANVFAYLVVFWFDFEHASKISMHPKGEISKFLFFQRNRKLFETSVKKWTWRVCRFSRELQFTVTKALEWFCR